MLPSLKKRIQLPDLELPCPICKEAEEDSIHLFVNCLKTNHIWAEILKWNDISWVSGKTVIDHFFQFSNLMSGKIWKRALSSVWICTTTTIWKWRKDILFNQHKWDAKGILGEIKANLHSWYSVLF